MGVSLANHNYYCCFAGCIWTSKNLAMSCLLFSSKATCRTISMLKRRPLCFNESSNISCIYFLENRKLTFSQKRLISQFQGLAISWFIFCHKANIYGNRQRGFLVAPDLCHFYSLISNKGGKQLSLWQVSLLSSSWLTDSLSVNNMLKLQERTLFL